MCIRDRSKGGVGKTTTAVNLSAALAISGRRVLLIDTDTQAQAGKSLGLRPDLGLADFMLGHASFNEAVVEARPNLHLLAGCLLYTSPSPRDRTRSRMPSFACTKKKHKH